MDIIEYWLLHSFGSADSTLSPWMRLVVFLGVILGAYLVDIIVSKLLLPGLQKLAKKTSTQWDDILLSDKVCRAASALLPPIVLAAALPWTVQGTLQLVIGKLTTIYIVINACRFLSALMGGVYNIFIYEERKHARSLLGILQTLQIVVWIIGVILIISILLGRSPLYLITGLGAAATVLMLIFQDSIKGLVAGIQLSLNDMLRVGEWICMPSRGVDGVVTEITLSTVKVQNWDNTLMTIQPYSLLTDTFQNWRGMSESAGRRLTRAVHVDMFSIRLLNAKEVADYQAKGYLPATAQPNIATNLEAFRGALYCYLRQMPEINEEMTLMVRQLPSTDEGVPVQVYAFSHTKVWEEYEEIQARIIEYMIAIMPQFGILPYQRSSDKMKR